jgi:hypothetical protein
VGFGQAMITAPLLATGAAAGEPSPWAMALATTAFGVATGWVLDEVSHRMRGGKGRRSRGR